MSVMPFEKLVEIKYSKLVNNRTQDYDILTLYWSGRSPGRGSALT